MANSKLKPKKATTFTPYENENLGVKFSLPDKLTVNQQLRLRGAIAMSEGGALVFLRMWEGALQLLKDWECALIPDPQELDLDEEDDPQIAQIVQWVADTTAGHVSRLGVIGKNA